MIVEQASIKRNLNSISSLSTRSVLVRGGERGVGVGEIQHVFTLSCVSVIVEKASIKRNLNSISSLSIQSVSVRGGEREWGRGNAVCPYLKLCISDGRTGLYQKESELYQLFVYPVCLSVRWGEGWG